ALSSIYFGYQDGDFFFVRRLFDDAERDALKAPPGTNYMVQSIERGARGGEGRGTYLYLDASLQVLRQDDRPDYVGAYDPRSRDWFKDALGAPSLIRTSPYVFFSNRKVGMTLAARANNGYGVVGVDILLETLGASLARQKVTPGTQIALVDPQGFVIAHEDVAKLVTVPDTPDARPALTRIGDLGVPILSQLAGVIPGLKDGKPHHARMQLDGEDWRVTINPVQLDNTPPLYLINAIPDRELLAAAIKLRSTSLLIIALIILISIPLTWFAARTIARPLRALLGEAESIRHFEFSQPVLVHSMVLEVDELAATMDGMKRTIRRFIDISAAVAAEEDFERLLPMLLRETLAAADADGGVLYLADEQNLLPATAGGEDGAEQKGTLPVVAMDGAGPLLQAALQDSTAHAGVLQEADMACLGLGTMVATIGATHGIAVPLLNRRHQLVGAIMLLRRNAIEDSQLSFVQALSGSAASSLETRELIKAQKDLFEAFIQLLAGAIDAKSPYTG
ncbi:MAG: GAF domain-containing protein, partial [Burkholderiales bacterium]